MESKDLCLTLVKAENEREVIKALKEGGFWNDTDAWSFFGGRENNFSTIGNQQSRPEQALVEKIINSVDAVLMRECLKRGIDPEGSSAPKSVKDAVIGYFKIRQGRLSNIGTQERLELANNICLVATGKKPKPNFTIIDKGEGQTPERFADTLLSLDKGNKIRIPFVQGKFNMGGTGALRFCGKNNLQLVISKRCPEIISKQEDTTSGLWGFTVVRREDPGKGVRNSTYKYLAPNREVLSFEGNGLSIWPGDYPDPYGNDLEWGTVVKLYEYHMLGLSTNILFDLYNRLSLLMPVIGLPVRLFERRKGYKGHTLETTVSGLSVRLEEDKRENLEAGFPTSSQINVDREQMKVQVYAFKPGARNKYAKEEGIVFIVNGQTHGFISKAFFDRKAVRLGTLSNSVLVIVDCSYLNGRIREDFFMNSRDRLSSGPFTASVERELEELLKTHQGLRDLKERRRREEIEEKLSDSQPFAKLLEDILKKSPILAALFITGTRLTDPFKTKKASEKDDFVGRRFPSFFKLEEDYSKKEPKSCNLKTRFRVQYRTDANNDYFDRDNDPGDFSLSVGGKLVNRYTLNLWNGIANLTVSLPDNVAENEILVFKSTVEDISRVEPFEEEFYVKVLPKTKPRKGGEGGRKPPANDEGEGDTKTPSKLAIPPIIEIRKDEWKRHEFNRESALRVVGDEHGFTFYVNMDNIHLKTELKHSDPGIIRLLEARYKFALALISMALLNEYQKKEDDELEEGEGIYAKISKIAAVISPIVLPMIAELGSLSAEDTDF